MVPFCSKVTRPPVFCYVPPGSSQKNHRAPEASQRMGRQDLSPGLKRQTTGLGAGFHVVLVFGCFWHESCSIQNWYQYVLIIQMCFTWANVRWSVENWMTCHNAPHGLAVPRDTATLPLWHGSFRPTIWRGSRDAVPRPIQRL